MLPSAASHHFSEAGRLLEENSLETRQFLDCVFEKLSGGSFMFHLGNAIDIIPLKDDDSGPVSAHSVVFRGTGANTC